MKPKHNFQLFGPGLRQFISINSCIFQPSQQHVYMFDKFSNSTPYLSLIQIEMGNSREKLIESGCDESSSLPSQNSFQVGSDCDISAAVKEGKTEETLMIKSQLLQAQFQPDLASKVFLRFPFVIDENHKHYHPHHRDANDDGGLTFPGICFHDVGDKDMGGGWGRDGPPGTTRHTSEQPHLYPWVSQKVYPWFSIFRSTKRIIQSSHICMLGVPKSIPPLSGVNRAKISLPKIEFGVPKYLAHALGTIWIRMCRPH